jgi:hypothetical protein
VGVLIEKVTALLAVPPTVTTTPPLVDPLGTVTTMLVSPHAVTLAVTPLKVTLLLPCVEPKLVPATVTMVPTVPLEGVKLVIAGAVDEGEEGFELEPPELCELPPPPPHAHNIMAAMSTATIRK